MKGMDVQFSSETELRLARLAAANGTNAEQLVKDSVGRMLETQAKFVAGVQRGIEQADFGSTIGHEEVRSRIDRLFEI